MCYLSGIDFPLFSYRVDAYHVHHPCVICAVHAFSCITSSKHIHHCTFITSIIIIAYMSYTYSQHHFPIKIKTIRRFFEIPYCLNRLKINPTCGPFAYLYCWICRKSGTTITPSEDTSNLLGFVCLDFRRKWTIILRLIHQWSA